MPTLANLFVYPVKSTRAVAVQRAEVTPRGLRGDRRWMLVDEEGRFISQRSEPRLTGIRSRWTPDGVWLQTDGMAPVFAPIPEASAPRRTVQIWDDVVDAAVTDAAVRSWCHAAVGRPCDLVYMPDDSRRPLDPDYGSPDDVVSFADGYPLLITTTASLADLNERMGASLSMQRFRPNLVLDTREPFAEDDWRRLRIGAVTVRLVKPCARCVVTTLDPTTGEGGKEPLRTLAQFRERDGKVYFGMNAIPEGPGSLQVGNAVEILAE
ncbi:MAG: MOSC domain-containing protein [Bacteroidetes bacterium]|jgi:uncharacterized protein YcbX|nr:MOSC domain-containing protein [Bacteroidota bacterium]